MVHKETFVPVQIGYMVFEIGTSAMRAGTMLVDHVRSAVPGFPHVFSVL